ncbi:unnamed protein product [Orchesella dallaii]|uniref:Chitin-binding type-2 domain-containing protein n=1 Tax=Orchesella dallaii TaxID=48710 RepID=A0ABP1QT55_9HEXA
MGKHIIHWKLSNANVDSSHFDCAAAGANKNGVSKFPFPSNCENYMYCVKGKGFLQKCPPGTAYNHPSKDCDIFETVSSCTEDVNVVRDNPVVAGEKYEGKDVNDCSMRDSGLYPMLFGDCSEYIFCKSNRAYAKKCPLNLLFDMDTLECTMPANARCWKPTGPSGPNKFFPLHIIEYYPNFEDENEPLVATMANPDGPMPAQKECIYKHRPHAKKFDPTEDGIILASPILKNDGNWLEWQYCNPGSYANAVGSFRRSKMQNGKTDNVGVISVALACQFPDQMGKLGEINSTIFDASPGAPKTDSQFSRFFHCEDGAAAVGFQLNSEPDQGAKDDIATANVRLLCSCGPPAVKPYWIEGVYSVDANRQGEWTKERGCMPRQAICGMQTQMMPYENKVALGTHDNSGLNNVKMKCCNIPNPIDSCTPLEKEVLIATCDNTASSQAQSCEFDGQVGVDYDYSNFERAAYFYESTGFTLEHQLGKIQEKMASSDLHCAMETCLFQWENSTSIVWKKMVRGLLKTNVVAGWTSEIYQIMGQCGIYLMYTNRFMRMDTDTLNRVKITRDSWDFNQDNFS